MLSQQGFYFHFLKCLVFKIILSTAKLHIESIFPPVVGAQDLVF